jgi:hypothetical protein
MLPPFLSDRSNQLGSGEFAPINGSLAPCDVGILQAEVEPVAHDRLVLRAEARADEIAEQPALSSSGRSGL